MRKQLLFAAVLGLALAGCRGDSPAAPEQARPTSAAAQQIRNADTTGVFLNDATGSRDAVADSTATEQRGGGFMGGGT